MKPVRTCVGCRQRAFREELVRLVIIENQLVVDLRASTTGRGAWLHASLKCLDQAVSKRVFARALRTSQKLDTTGLTTQIEQAEMMLAKNE